MDPHIIQARRQAVRRTVDQIRQQLDGAPITRDALARVEPLLSALGRQQALFPLEDFPLHPEFDGVIYRLDEQPDHSFALFASVGRPGKARNVHNHTTWAVIAGVHGDEHNQVFVRCDDGSDPAHGALRKLMEKTVSPGGVVSMLADDYHCISVGGTSNSLHLHMYGMSHAYLPNRTGFKSREGGALLRYPLSYSIGFVSPAELRAMLSDDDEVAVIDVREEGVFGRDGHLLLASNLPYSRLECLAPHRLPRKAVRLVVCDGNDGLAQRAAILLMKSGYSQVHVLEGGAPAWQAAGFRLYGGLNVPSKAFAEVLAHRQDTPQLAADTLHAWAAQGEPHCLVDCRPAEEFAVMSVPGATQAAGFDLVRQAYDLSSAGQLPLVVNCAGRTRSLMAMHSLRAAGLPLKAHALLGGTMGWTLAGYALESGRAAPPLAVSVAARQHNAAIKARLSGSGRFRIVDRGTVDTWRQQSERTTYVFDVRSSAEYAASHVPGARQVAGAQLVHTQDAHLPVHRARVVLCDDDGVRAALTAYWLSFLTQHDIFVLDGLGGGRWEAGEAPPVLLREPKAAAAVLDPTAVAAGVDEGRYVVVDLSLSAAYRAGHPPGAWHAIRSRLMDALPQLAGGQAIVLTSEDGIVAWLAAAEAAAATSCPVHVLMGGNAAWRQAGLPWEVGTERWTGSVDDVWLRAHQQAGDAASAMREYLQWELDLVQAVASDADFHFRDRIDAIQSWEPQA